MFGGKTEIFVLKNQLQDCQDRIDDLHKRVSLLECNNYKKEGGFWDEVETRCGISTETYNNYNSLLKNKSITKDDIWTILKVFKLKE